jgi:RNA polymerase sigma-70 factor (ECF subfamily)
MLFRKPPLSSDVQTDFTTREGFERIYRAHAKTMFNIVYNKLGDKETSKEIVQDIFKSLWERRDEIVLASPLQHYLFRAAKLKVLDHFRKKAVRENRLAEIANEWELAIRDFEAVLRYKDLQGEIECLVARLPPQCRAVYGFSREEGFSNKEIAFHLSISEKTVEAHLAKALRFLKENLKGFQPA